MLNENPPVPGVDQPLTNQTRVVVQHTYTRTDSYLVTLEPGETYDDAVKAVVAGDVECSDKDDGSDAQYDVFVANGMGQATDHLYKRSV